MYASGAWNGENLVSANRDFRVLSDGRVAVSRYPPRGQEVALARDAAKAVLSRSNVTAFCALSVSPSLTRYVLGV